MKEEQNNINVSVVVPFLNEQRHIREAVISIFNQERRPDEIIFVNNSSNDDTENMVRDLIKDIDIKTRIVLEKNKGIPFARNKGINEARGDIIIFLDADCIAPKNYIKKILEGFSNNKVEAITGRYLLSGQDRTKAVFRQSAWSRHFNWCERKIKHKRIHNQIGTLVSGCSSFRKDILQYINLYDPRIKYMDDVALSYKFYNFGFTSLYDPGLVVVHNINTKESAIFKKDFRYGSDQARINYLYRRTKLTLSIKEYVQMGILLARFIKINPKEFFYVFRTFLYFKLGLFITGLKLKSFYL